MQAKEHPRLGPDDLARLVEATPDRYRVLAAGVLGLRWGELAGLRIEDVDPLRGEVRVARQLAELAGQLTVEAPKTGHGVRTLAAPPFLTRELADHIRLFRADAALEDPLFTAPRGGLLRRHFVRRILQPAAERAGLSDALTAHGLRHVAMALMVEVGEHPKVMQRRLGHADPRLTLAVYAHSSDDADRSAAQRMERLFTSPEDGASPVGYAIPCPNGHSCVLVLPRAGSSGRLARSTIRVVRRTPWLLPRRSGYGRRQREQVDSSRSGARPAMLPSAACSEPDGRPRRPPLRCRRRSRCKGHRRRPPERSGSRCSDLIASPRRFRCPRFSLGELRRLPRSSADSHRRRVASVRRLPPR